jgi:DNA-binding response OmpR family regulator
MRILECLMRNVGIPMGRERLIERIWGYDYLGDRNRVDVYVARLRKKIERNPSQPDYLITLRDIGYMFRIPSGSIDLSHRPTPPESDAIEDSGRSRGS